MSALAWLTWRQHRWTILGTAILALAAAYALVTTDDARLGAMTITGFYGLIVQLAFGCVIGMFWGAPLIARELEERTYFVAWGQDVTPVKWLRGKALLLGPMAVVLGALVGIDDGFTRLPRSWGTFESTPIAQAGYAIFGFALGVLIGLLSRHVVSAMAATLVFYGLVRTLVAGLLRDHYLPAERVISSWEDTAKLPDRALELGTGFMGADLDPVPVLDRCGSAINTGSCMRNAKAAIGTYLDYQPIGRFWIFQFIEFGLFVLLAAGLFAVTFRLLRGGGGWKPSRSHRRIAPELAESEPAQSEPAESEPAESESAESEPTQSEPDQFESAQTEPDQSEPAQSEPAESEPDQSAPSAAAATHREG